MESNASKNKKMANLSERQLQIMKLLWQNEGGMTASELEEASGEMCTSTVRASLMALLKKKYVEVGEIVYSGTVLSRKYIPLISEEEYFNHSIQKIGVEIESVKEIVNSCNNIELLDSFLDMIEGRKRELSKK